MPKHLRDDLRVHVAGEQQRGARVAEVVEADRRQPRSLQERLELHVRNGAPVERLARLGGEHEAVLAPQGAHLVYLRKLALQMASEGFYGPLSKLHAAPRAGRLRGCEDKAVLGNGKCSADLEGAVVEVHVVPL